MSESELPEPVPAAPPAHPLTYSDILLNAASEMLDGHVVGVVIAVKLINEDGNQCFFTTASEGMGPWDTLGMFAYAQHMAKQSQCYVEQSSVEDAEEYEDEE